MATLTMDGTTIEVAELSEEKSFEVGGSARAIDGTGRSGVRSRKRVWRGRTIFLAPADGTTQRTALELAPPLAMDGDAIIGGPINVRCEILGEAKRTQDGAIARSIQFRLFER